MFYVSEHIALRNPTFFSNIDNPIFISHSFFTISIELIFLSYSMHDELQEDGNSLLLMLQYFSPFYVISVFQDKEYFVLFGFKQILANSKESLSIMFQLSVCSCRNMKSTKVLKIDSTTISN